MNDLRLRHNIHCITSAVITVLHLRLFEIHKKIGIEKPQSINDRTLYKKIRPRDIRDFKWFLRNTDCRVDRFKSQYVFIDEKYWGGKLTESHTNVYMEDTNRDGKEEIILQRQNSEGEIRRTIFGFGADGRLETLEESEAEQISEEPKEIQGE